MQRPSLLALCVALVATGCRGANDDQDATRKRVDDRGRVVLTSEERKAVGLEVVAVAQGNLTTSALRFGKVVARPQEDALIVAPVNGRLVAPTLALGSQVSPGDLLITIEPLVDTASRATLEAQRRELQGQLESARAQVQAKKTDLARVTTLVSSGLATDADRSQAEATLTSEQARAESLQRAGGALAQMTGGRMELRSPASGVVATLATESGSLIQQGTVVARIVRAGPRWIDIAVPPGDPVGDGYRAQGLSAAVSLRLLARGSVIQADGTRRDRLEAPPEAAPGLPPGATVPVEVLHETRGVLVQMGAVVRRGRDTLVFVEVEANRYEARTVQISARDDARAVVASGLAVGDRAVTRGAASLLGELGAAGGGSGVGEHE